MTCASWPRGTIRYHSPLNLPMLLAPAIRMEFPCRTPYFDPPDPFRQNEIRRRPRNSAPPFGAVVYPLEAIDHTYTFAYGDYLIVMQSWGLMLARNRGCHQSGILRYTVQLYRPIAIHTFG